MDFESFKSDKLVQLPNAYQPMLVTLSGIEMLVKLRQYSNAPVSIFVTPLGIVTLTRLEQLEKA